MSDMSHKDKMQLNKLNDEVNQSIANRTEWLDSKMTQYADAQVGEVIYNLVTGELLGKVSELYRYQASQNELFDTSLSINYRFEMAHMSNCFDNTSRMGRILVGTKK